MKTSLIGYLLVGLLSLACFAQQNTHTVSAVVKDKAGTPIQGMTLSVSGGEKPVDVNTNDEGQFSIALPPGDYVLKAESAIYKNFQINIKVPETGLVPVGAVFRAEPVLRWCANCSDGDMPEIVAHGKLHYPPTAIAVGANGEVAVKVAITKAGKVRSVEQISGHPLLQQISAKFAKDFQFTKSSEIDIREAVLIFAFTLCAKEGCPGKEATEFLIQKPNRIVIYRFHYNIISTTNW